MSKRSKRTSYGIDQVRKRLVGLENLVLKGSILAIDPSCVSTSSNPGWAWYVKGKLDSSGEIDSINPRLPLERRLQLLGKTIREDFEEPDILVIEHIGTGGKSYMESLIRATGTIIGNFECEHVIPISPLAWQAYIQKKIPLGGENDYIKYKEYKEKHKSDRLDAEMMGLAIVEICKEG